MHLALATSQGRPTALFHAIESLRPLVEAAKSAKPEEIMHLRREWTHRTGTNAALMAHPEFETLRSQLFTESPALSAEPHYKSTPTWIAAL